MAIEYSYEIISVDQDARCMEVVYSSSGRPTQHIGARLPFEGESLEAVIRMFAPVPYWSELESSVVAPSVGVSGQISEIEIPLSDRVRIERDAALSASDWTQVADAPVDKTAWATYRQALRDIPQQAGFPDNVTWPSSPA
jgi:hypothetical protein